MRSCRLTRCMQGMGLGASPESPLEFASELTVSTGTCSPWATLEVGLGYSSAFVSPWFGKGEKESQMPCLMADFMIRGTSASMSKGLICLFLEAGSAAVWISEWWMTFRVSSIRILNITHSATNVLTYSDPIASSFFAARREGSCLILVVDSLIESIPQ